jgi:hypothetical protein
VSRRHDDGSGVPAPAGDAAAQSNQAVRAAPCGVCGGLTAGSAGAGRGCSPSVSVAVMRARAGVPRLRVHRSVQAGAKASSPRSFRMWRARRMILRASDRAARLPFLRSLTWA